MGRAFRKAAGPRWAPYAIVVAACLLALVPFIPFKVDDAFISFVYARNLATGQGLTYNGALIEGYSNFLWVLLLTPFVAIGIDPMAAARGLSVASALASALLVLQLCRRMVSNPGGALPVLATATVAVLAPIAAWTMGGLETAFASLLLVLLVWNEWEDRPRIRALSPLLLVMVALTRPEGIGFLPIWLVSRLVRRNARARETAAGAAFVAAVLGVFVIWRWNTYGHFLPNTAYLKLGPTLQTTLNAALWLGRFFALRPPFGLLLVAGVVLSTVRLLRGERRLALPLGLTAGLVAFVLVAGSDWMPHHRFLAPAVPIMGLFVAAALDAFRGRILRGALAALALAAIGFELTLANTLYRPVTVEFGLYTDGLVRAGRRIARETSPAATIAVVDAGALAYYGDRTTIDILGLNDDHIARCPGHTDAAYVLEQEPEVIQLHVELSASGEPIPAGEAAGNRDVLRAAAFRDCYVLDPARPDDPYYPYLFVRTCDRVVAP